MFSKHRQSLMRRRSAEANDENQNVKGETTSTVKVRLHYWKYVISPFEQRIQEVRCMQSNDGCCAAFNENVTLLVQ